jgi:hypothetical protein
MAGSRYPMEQITCGSGALVGKVSMPYPGQVPMFRYSGSMARNVRMELHVQRIRLDVTSI